MERRTTASLVLGLGAAIAIATLGCSSSGTDSPAMSVSGKSSGTPRPSGDRTTASAAPKPSASAATSPTSSTSAAVAAPSGSAGGPSGPAADYFRLVDRALEVIEKTPDCDAFKTALAAYRKDFPEGTATRVIHANDLDHPYEVGFMGPNDTAAQLKAFRAAHPNEVEAVQKRWQALKDRMKGQKECSEMQTMLEDIQCIDMLVATLPK